MTRAPSLDHLRGMRVTDASKAAAFSFGYAAFRDGARSRAQLSAISTVSYIPAEAWQFVRGWEAAQDDLRAGHLFESKTVEQEMGL